MVKRRHQVTSGLTPSAVLFLSTLFFVYSIYTEIAPFPWGENPPYGSATLLPQVVPVKRETP